MRCRSHRVSFKRCSPMPDKPLPRYVVDTDGTTVWVNGNDGACWGRFSKFGIDVHHTGREQVAGKIQCLDCTAIEGTENPWQRFVDSMKRFHDVAVADKYRPKWLS